MKKAEKTQFMLKSYIPGCDKKRNRRDKRKQSQPDFLFFGAARTSGDSSVAQGTREGREEGGEKGSECALFKLFPPRGSRVDA